MYKYSRSAQDTFFEHATFAFLFAWFEACPQAKSFSREKFTDNANAGYPERMMSEVEQLGVEAQLKLHQERIGDKMRHTLSSYLVKAKAEWRNHPHATTCSEMSEGNSLSQMTTVPINENSKSTTSLLCI